MSGSDGFGYGYCDGFGDGSGYGSSWCEGRSSGTGFGFSCQTLRVPV